MPGKVIDRLSRPDPPWRRSLHAQILIMLERQAACIGLPLTL